MALNPANLAVTPYILNLKKKNTHKPFIINGSKDLFNEAVMSNVFSFKLPWYMQLSMFSDRHADGLLALREK